MYSDISESQGYPILLQITTKSLPRIIKFPTRIYLVTLPLAFTLVIHILNT